MWLEEFAHSSERQRTHEFIDHSATAEQFDGRNAADLKLLRQVLVFVGVHLDDLDLAFLLAGDLLEHRPKRAARAAPGGPEVDQDGLRGGGVDDLGGEVGRGYGGDGGVHGHAIGMWCR